MKLVKNILLIVVCIICMYFYGKLMKESERTDSILRRGDRVKLKNRAFHNTCKLYFITSVKTSNSNVAVLLLTECGGNLDSNTEVGLTFLETIEKVR